MTAKKTTKPARRREDQVLVRDRMTAGLEKVHKVVRLQDAAQRMRDVDVGLLAVYDGSELLGVLTDRDLVVRVVAQGLDPSKTAVSDAMSPGLFRCREDDALSDALDQMATHHVRRLVVVDVRGEAVGLISVDDAARVEAEQGAVAAVLASTND